MKIIKHKESNFTVEEIIICLENDDRLKDTAMNITFEENGEAVVVVEPLGLEDVNIFGEINEDYELIYYNEN